MITLKANKELLQLFLEMLEIYSKHNALHSHRNTILVLLRVLNRADFCFLKRFENIVDPNRKYKMAIHNMSVIHHLLITMFRRKHQIFYGYLHDTYRHFLLVL